MLTLSFRSGVRTPSSASRPLLRGCTLAVSLALASLLVAPAAEAAADSGKPAANALHAHGKAHRHAGKAAATAAVAAPMAVPAADALQMEAMARVNQGVSTCEFRQQVHISESAAHPGYVDLRFKGKQWLMKPVISSTGALRLEDVRAETLFIQIRNKSMLMNQKTGQRLVDACVHPAQQQAMSRG